MKQTKWEEASEHTVDVFITEIDGNPVAIFDAHCDRTRAKIGAVSIQRLSETPTGWIHDLWVHPDYRRNGVARNLMRRLLIYAERCKMEGVSLKVRVDNEAAIQLYHSLGFFRAGEEEPGQALMCRRIV